MIPNFHFVEPGIWRGAQPDDPRDWEVLSELGVTQIIKLNTDEEGIDTPFGGAVIFKCPITLSEQILLEPDKQSMIDAVGFIVPGTFVHCGSDARSRSEVDAKNHTQGGQDRTGLVIAMYRVKACGWTKQDAEYEMLRFGFHRILVGLWLFWENWEP